MSRALWTLLLIGGPLHAQPLAPAEWPSDEVFLNNGGHFFGQIVAEGAEGIRFRVVSRRPGRPTVTLTTLFTPGEVAAVKKLTEARRAELAARLAALDPDGSGERSRMQELPLAAAEWPGGGPALVYRSDRFTLVSDAPDLVTRRAAVRLEQIFAAYARFLPAQTGRGPTRILFAGTQASYRAALVAALGPAGGQVANPAVFDPKTDQIVCGSDLARLAEDLAAANRKHAAGRAQLDAADAELRRLYKASPADLDRFLKGTAQERERLKSADRANDRAFDRAVDRLLTLLYHEAFHAYAAAAYPVAGGDPGLPRWLNEGLAQVFETAVVEAGELRVGHADPARLERARALLKPDSAGLVPVADVLRSGRATFLAAHAGERARTDRAYLTAWALTFYLTFDCRLVGGKGFERYLRDAPRDPVAAFEAWAGQGVPAFERDFRDYLERLKPDGTAAPPAN